MSVGPTERQGWIERKWSARAVGAIAYLVPFFASIAAAVVLSVILPVAPNVFLGIVRWIGVAVASTVVLILVERQTRRLMPLRTLLGLSLVFPDKAPSRFKIAIRTGTTNQLRQRLDEARKGRLGDTPSEAAERLLELVGMLSQHDRLTRGHSERVRAYSQMIGAEMGLSHRELDRLRWAGLLHDVGKLAIDPGILNKPGKLTVEEFDLIKTHPMEGKALVEPLASWLGDAARAVWEHHERFDGGGYPVGLAGTDISQAARIVSVADVFDVITSVRSYKTATSARAAREELARCAGTQFDPEVVRAFLALSMGQVRTTMGPLSWFAQLAFLPGAVAAQAGPALASAAVVTAGLTAGTVGIVIDSGPLIADRTEFVAAAGEPAAAPPITVSTGGAASGSSDAGAAPDDPGAPGDDVATTIDDGAPVVRFSDTTTTTSPGTASSPDGDVDGDGDGDGDVDGDSGGLSPTSSLVSDPTDAITTSSSTTPPGGVSVTTAVPSAQREAAATTTTAAPTTNTITTTPPAITTTTTTVSDIDTGDHLYLLGSGAGDQGSQSVLPFGDTRPADVALPNHDTDRDAAPGLLLQKDSSGVNGTDSTKVQRWRTGFDVARRIDTPVRVELHVAAKDFQKKDIRVQAQVLKCGLSGCQSLGVGDKEVLNADRFKRVSIDFGDIDTMLLLGETLELRMAILGDSEDDAWLAFGTENFDACIHLH